MVVVYQRRAKRNTPFKVYSEKPRQNTEEVDPDFTNNGNVKRD